MNNSKPSRDEILSRHPLRAECEKRNLKFNGEGKELTASCPFHEDGKRPNFLLNEEKGTWFCHVCNLGGGVVEFVAKMDGKSTKEVFTEWAKETNGATVIPSSQQPTNTYDYRNESWEVVYQACRYYPKTFKQRHMVNGKWAWNMDGVTRILYRLPQVLGSQVVWIVEGEKDADSLNRLGFIATTNVGGAGKWLDGYTESLKGKDIILCGDNDEPGRAHVDKVLVSIREYVHSVKVVRVPEPHKDVSDWIPTFPDQPAAKAAIQKLADDSPVIGGFYMLPIKGMQELEAEYCKFIDQSEDVGVDISRWLPSFRGKVRPLVPGEFACFIADTGQGKTALLQNLAFKAGVTTLLFELELPGTLTFERFVGIATGYASHDVVLGYKAGGPGQISFGNLKHVFVCDRSGLTVQEMKRLIQASALKIGSPPVLVLVDYVQLVRGDGNSRYERTSSVAEGLKVLAKELNVIVVASSQIGRKEKGASPEIGLHDGKNAGEIENSAGLLIGVWRDDKSEKTMHLKILKNTKGLCGYEVLCTFNGETMQIMEESKTADADIPPTRRRVEEPASYETAERHVRSTLPYADT